MALSAVSVGIRDFLAGNVRAGGGFEAVWRDSALFAELRGPSAGGACGSCQFYDSCRGGCMAAKFFTGLPLDGPDPECVRGFGEQALSERARAGQAGRAALPRPALDHSHRGPVRGQAGHGQARHGLAPRPVPVTIGRRPVPAPPDRACDVNPLAGFTAGGTR